MSFAALRSLGVLALGFGCAYYNGLYNANQLAKEATRAERDGRVEEARSLWTLAAQKAGVVAEDYPESEYWDDALLLKGLALRNIDRCSEAVAALELTASSGDTRAVRDEARLLWGACLVDRDLPDSAFRVLSPLIGRGPIPVLDEARWWRGMASMQMENWEDALVDLDLTNVPQAPWYRAEVLSRLNRNRDAASVLDSAVVLRFQESLWSRVLSVVGETSPVAASSLVDRLIQKRELTPGQRARLLIADANRWATLDRAFAMDRLRTAVLVGGHTLEASHAQRRLLSDRFRRTFSLDSARSIGWELYERINAAGDLDPALVEYGQRVRWVLTVLDSTGFSHRDVAFFRAAELLRDSLQAPAPAAIFFGRLAEDFPDSPLAVKALLAQAALNPADAHDLERLARARYPDSPYLPLPSGSYSADLIALEDSLAPLFNLVRREGTGNR